MFFFFLVPLDFVVGVFVVLCLLGVGWAMALGSWLWSHAIIIGIIFLICHVLIALVTIPSTAEAFGIPGGLLELIHSFFVPFILITAYRSCVETGEVFGFNLFINWVILLGAVNVAECIWFKAVGSQTYFRFFVWAVVAFFAYAVIINIVLREGFL